MILKAFRNKKREAKDDLYFITEDNFVELITKEEYAELMAMKPEVKCTEEDAVYNEGYIIEMANFPRDILKKYSKILLKAFYERGHDFTESQLTNIKSLEEFVFSYGDNPTTQQLRAKLNFINKILFKEVEKCFEEVVNEKIKNDPLRNSRLEKISIISALGSTAQLFKTTYFIENEKQIGMTEKDFCSLIDKVSFNMTAKFLKF